MSLQWLHYLHISWIENFSPTHNSTIILHILHVWVMKMKPQLHDGTIMVDLDKNRSVEFLLVVVSHQTMNWQGFCKYLKRNHHKQRREQHLHVNCACTIGMFEPWPPLPQNGIMLELRRFAASQNCRSCHKWFERGYYGRSNVVLWVK